MSAPDFAEPKRVLQAFLDAGTRGDLPTMQACVTRQTLGSGKLDASAAPEGMGFVMDEPRQDGDRVVIPIRAYPIGMPAEGQPAFAMNCFMVQEDGQWKFDLPKSAEGMMAGLEAAMGEIASAMGKAMEGVGKAMTEGLKEAFGEKPSSAKGKKPHKKS